jgi:hypothetical protein
MGHSPENKAKSCWRASWPSCTEVLVQPNGPRVRQNEAMVSRLVLRPGTGDPAVRIERAPEPESADVPSLHLGSQDLIRVAGFAAANGFQIARFYVSDSYLLPLGDDEQCEISGVLVDVLGEYDAQEVESTMADEYDGLYIVGVELISPTTGLRINLRRRGYISTSVAEEREAELLLSDAWRELRLA